jgi:hypothetical protein
LKLDELLSLFGHLVDSSEAKSFFSKYTHFDFEDPDDGCQYAISENLGLDLLYRPDDGLQGGNTDDIRKCQSAFLFSQGRDDHQQYQGEIPLGFSFKDSREILIGKHKPVRTWKIGSGEVPINTPEPSSDRWVFKGFFISAHYTKSGSLMYFIVSRKNA